ncbi:MAG: M28 family metallopeptidase, partial [Candidatus Zixiibacteriota bacterium]
MDIVKSIVSHARGTIDGMFIVDLDNNQSGVLKKAGVRVQLLQSNCRLDETYLVLKEDHRLRTSAININSLYETANSCIALLEKNSLGVLAREGYMPRLLVGRETPFFYYQPMAALPALDSYAFDTLASLIEYDSLYNSDTRLEAFYTRFVKSDSCLLARDWIRQKFYSYGYSDVFYQTFLATREGFNVINVPAYNVVCVKEGTTKPNEWIIIGAHYDSFTWGCSYDVNAPAPGADDNASGISAVLELARLYKDIDFQRSIMFVAFGAEEEGLWGSEYIANQMYENNEKIYFMLNFDVISYENQAPLDFRVTHIRQKGFGQVFKDANARLDGMPFETSSTPMSSDDRSFDDYGFQTVGLHEHDYFAEMHTTLDASWNISFDLMYNITRIGVVSVPIIDAAADPIESELADMGTGDALRMSWDSCFTDWNYQIVYGTSEYNLSDTADVPALECYYDIQGLTEGVEYYAAVIGQPQIGEGPIAVYVNSMIPYSTPRTPENFVVEPEINSVKLSWTANSEIDFSHYKVMRKATTEPDWTVIVDNLNEVYYIDNEAVSHTVNNYRIYAVDNDMNESAATETYSAIPATFDLGILLVDETQDVDGFPTEAQQSTFYSAILDTFTFGLKKVDEGDYLTRSTAGQYNPLFWIDDDSVHNELAASWDSLAWYLNLNTDFLLAGWKTIYSMTGQT